MTTLPSSTEAVLLIDDNRTDAAFIKRSLESQSQSRDFELLWVDRLAKGLELVVRKDLAAVVLSLMLPDSVGLATLQRLRQTNSDVPILVLTSVYDERLAAAALRTGAEEFLVKDEVDERSVARALRYAIERSRGRAALEASKNVMGKIRVLRQGWNEARSPLDTVQELVSLVAHGLAGKVNIQQYEYLCSALKSVDEVNDVIDHLDVMSKARGSSAAAQRGVAGVPAAVPVAAAGR